ncbi:unnamed protein product [Chrysoparadoxa australica]
MAAKKKATTAENGSQKFLGVFPMAVRESIGPLILLVGAPIFCLLYWHMLCELDGKFATIAKEISTDGFWSVVKSLPSPMNGQAWNLILSFAAYELLLMRVLPGPDFSANATATGSHVPVYKANGMLSYLVTLATYAALVANGWDSSIVYDLLGEILSALCVSALVLVLMLYFKGIYAPSTADSGSSGNFVKDYYWGTELYPRVLGWDIKLFTNSRFGMMYWAVGLLCYAHKQINMYGYISDSMCVSVVLQLVYISKFFYWETGYMCSMDIQHDRAGYYICWGCLVWLPTIYTSSSMYLATRPVELGVLAPVIFVVGFLAILANYDADRQRQHFRDQKGNVVIWGKPAEQIVAHWVDASGEPHTSLLLCSGWWSFSRHLHYLFEITAAFCWSVPALFEAGGPYFYVTFLIILLFDRAFRDDARCSKKYGKDWDKYRERIPWKVIPGVI